MVATIATAVLHAVGVTVTPAAVRDSSLATLLAAAAKLENELSVNETYNESLAMSVVTSFSNLLNRTFADALVFPTQNSADLDDRRVVTSSMTLAAAAQLADAYGFPLSVVFSVQTLMTGNNSVPRDIVILLSSALSCDPTVNNAARIEALVRAQFIASPNLTNDVHAPVTLASKHVMAVQSVTVSQDIETVMLAAAAAVSPQLRQRVAVAISHPVIASFVDALARSGSLSIAMSAAALAVSPALGTTRALSVALGATAASTGTVSRTASVAVALSIAATVSQLIRLSPGLGIELRAAASLVDSAKVTLGIASLLRASAQSAPLVATGKVLATSLGASADDAENALTSDAAREIEAQLQVAARLVGGLSVANVVSMLAQIAGSVGVYYQGTKSAGVTLSAGTQLTFSPARTHEESVDLIVKSIMDELLGLNHPTQVYFNPVSDWTQATIRDEQFHIQED
jgi:hypothetical protein